MRNILIRLFEKLRRPPPRKPESARLDCLARRHAGCHDDAHCPYCNPTEQALRAATRFDDGA